MYTESYPDFIDQSLAEGLVRRYTRAVKERCARVPTPQLQMRWKQLEAEVIAGVPRKKRSNHFSRYVKELAKARAVVPVMGDGDPFAGLALLSTVEKFGKDHLKVEFFIIDYSEKSIVLLPNQIEVDTNHFLVRWLQREQVKSINVAVAAVSNGCLALSALPLATLVKSRPSFTDDASLKLPSGGYLLGKVNPDNTKNFLARTYISENMAKAHNLEQCLNPQELREEWDWNDEFEVIQRHFSASSK